ncbi:MAG: hypothetical protein HYX90_02710 [Chloroflexi bacterium]|nr:hypothetical protein [Chloroflexota bacterium]
MASPATTPMSTPSPTPTSKLTSSAAPSPVSFAGKTITIIVPSTAGSGTDVTARTYARYLGKFLAGNPTVVVRDMPGGGGMIGANYAYAVKPDGLTVLAPTGGVLLNQSLGMKGVRYDLLKMAALAAGTSGGVYYMKPGIIDRPENILKAKGIIFGATGAGSYLFVAANELLIIPTEKVVLAYAGTAETRRAFMSGEINMTFDGTPMYLENVVPQVAKGEVMPVFQFGRLDEKGDIVKDQSLPSEILTTKELHDRLYGKAPSGIAWEAYKGIHAATYNYDKFLFVTPGVSGDTVKAYWDAADKMVRDAEFRRVIELLAGKGARWTAGEAFDKEFKLTFGMDPKVVDWLRSTLAKSGVVVD